MLIGKDFDKIEFDFLGLELVEPNSFIGDSLIFIFALIFAVRIKKLNFKGPFKAYWTWFFVVFGVGFFLGGFGHLLFLYLGVPGKVPSLYFGIFAAYFIEQAMISIHPNEQWRARFKIGSIIKLMIALIGMTWIVVTVNMDHDPALTLKLPMFNSVIGLLFALAGLGFYYSRVISKAFSFLLISVLVQLPAVFFQSMKISLHPWFDRNDFSHLLLIVGMFFYYRAIKGYSLKREPLSIDG